MLKTKVWIGLLSSLFAVALLTMLIPQWRAGSGGSAGISAQPGGIRAGTAAPEGTGTAAPDGKADPTGSGTVANLYLDGVCVYSVDLALVEEEDRLIAEGNGGENLVVIQPGRICVAEADCPDQICVRQGWISRTGDLPIVCLPHGLVIQIENHAPEGYQSAYEWTDDGGSAAPGDGKPAAIGEASGEAGAP